MLKKILVSAFIVFTVTCKLNGQEKGSINDIIFKHRHLSAQQLLDTANYYQSHNNTDAAMICYNMLINNASKPLDRANQKKVVEAYSNSASIYYQKDDYRSAYELLLKALQLSESIDDATHKSRIYTNIGNIYDRFNKYDLAKFYYSEALDFSKDSVITALILNNLGYVEVKAGHLDSAFLFLNQSLQIITQHKAPYKHIVQHSLALYYKECKTYDSAYDYFIRSLNDVNNTVNQMAETFSDLGKLFFETRKMDSAVFYIGLSNAIATKYAFLGILMENYLLLSKIEEYNGRNALAFKYFKQHSIFRDSILSNEKIVEVDQLQYLYETAKMDKQIQKHVIIQQIKDQTIRYQKIIGYILLAVLIAISTILTVVYNQNKKLNKAYNVLFEKNIKIIELEDRSPELPKYKQSTLSDEKQDELLTRIYALMEDVSVICDPELSVEKLADLLHSNRAYVSQVINGLIKKKFRTFVNEYRIREAQRLFSEDNASKYTIEAIAFKTGFKSSTTFNTAFKEVTGVSPGFYIKSMQKMP